MITSASPITSSATLTSGRGSPPAPRVSASLPAPRDGSSTTTRPRRPVRTASARSSPSARPAASAPLNVSPAPVVSRGVTAGAGTSSAEPSIRTTSAPDMPRVTTTALPPVPAPPRTSRRKDWPPTAPSVTRARRSRAVASGSAPAGPPPARSASSASFGVRMSAIASVASSRSSAGAGLRIVVDPASRPISSAARTPSGGISRETSTTSRGPGASLSRADSTCCRFTSPFAPAATAMRFSPRGSTTIRATPVDREVTARPLRSIPSTASAERASLPMSSAPIAPTNATRAPSRAAAVAPFPPLPPGKRTRSAPVTVWPGPGSREAATTRSTLTAPTTSTRPPATGGLSRIAGTGRASHGVPYRGPGTGAGRRAPSGVASEQEVPR